jgi:hypothetical protein
MSVRNLIILLTLTAVALTVASPQAAAAQQITPASAPAVFDVADRAAILVVHGGGAQTYECKVGETAAMNWVFREPVAILILGGATIGHHYVGPTSELTDGEVVKGKQSAVAPGATPGDVALLKLDIIEHRGSGLLEDAKLGDWPPAAGSSKAHARQRASFARSPIRQTTCSCDNGRWADVGIGPDTSSGALIRPVITDVIHYMERLLTDRVSTVRRSVSRV